MNEDRSEAVGRVVLRLSLLGGLAFGLYFFVYQILDPPRIISCAGDPTEETLGPRRDFLPPALAATGAVIGVVGFLAITWNADVRQRLGRTGHMGFGGAILGFVSLLALAAIVDTGLTEMDVGGSLFFGLFSGLAGLVALGLIAVGFVGLITGWRTQPDWALGADRLVNGVAWTLLIFFAPAFTGFVISAGKDGTLFC